MFGCEDNKTSGGIALKIEAGFDAVDEDIGSLEKRIEDVIDELRHEVLLEFERYDTED